MAEAKGEAEVDKVLLVMGLGRAEISPASGVTEGSRENPELTSFLLI